MHIVGYVFRDNDNFKALQNSLQSLEKWLENKNNWIPISIDIEIFVVLALTILIILLLINVYKFFYDKVEIAREVADQYGDYIEVFLGDSMHKFPVELSLQNGKSYVGYVIKSQLTVMPTQRDVDIVLLPIVSGYRKKETGELVLTTFYFPEVLKTENDRNKMDEEVLQIFIPMSALVSVRQFDLEIYENFQKYQHLAPGDLQYSG